MFYIPLGSSDIQPSDTMPPDAMLTSIIGTSDKYARADHTHAVKVQRKVLTTDSNGQITWNFTQPFTNPPVVAILGEGTGLPLVGMVAAKSTSSVTIQMYRLQMLPSNLTLLLNLQSFNITAGTVGAGISVSVFAAEPT